MTDTGIPPDVQAHMTAADAAQATGDHAGRAAAATAALSAWSSALRPVPSAEPRTAAEASARLEHLNKSPEWRAKYFGGDTATVAEFNRLNEMVSSADPVELALAGVAPVDGIDENSGAVPSGRDVVAGVAHMREQGFNDSEIKEILTGRLVDKGTPLTKDEIAAGAQGAQRWLANATRDATFRKALLDGDQDARRRWDFACAVAASGRDTP
jgi:hypothetical protein